MHRRPFLLAGLSLLAVVSGCATTQTTPVATTPTPPATATPTEPTPTPRTASHYDCPYVLTVEVVSEERGSEADMTRQYSDLSAQAQREFRRGVRNGTVELGKRLPDRWDDPPHVVEYDGRQYSASVIVC
ncbi:hypothetical protein [Haloarcula salinisoli]|uniref:DUF7979 domain-containing protein n=1 Tax=Haloarcula salinisoli TaxID=2487746 RepID=A0A8J7YM18_9EURY|nr:hypothetical protein [Halomicroarcula salinisoli]MBX0288134.1 hypothetical protein [Halomicroarcula salinisoli]MBX0305269.1 hypothetical protein [Halomicroarcula salinisoli]